MIIVVSALVIATGYSKSEHSVRLSLLVRLPDTRLSMQPFVIPPPSTPLELHDAMLYFKSILRGVFCIKLLISLEDVFGNKEG